MCQPALRSVNRIKCWNENNTNFDYNCYVLSVAASPIQNVWNLHVLHDRKFTWWFVCVRIRHENIYTKWIDSSKLHAVQRTQRRDRGGLNEDSIEFATRTIWYLLITRKKNEMKEFVELVCARSQMGRGFCIAFGAMVSIYVATRGFQYFRWVDSASRINIFCILNFVSISSII